MFLQLYSYGGGDLCVRHSWLCVFDWISEDQDILIVNTIRMSQNRKPEEETICVYMTSLIKKNVIAKDWLGGINTPYTCI